MRGLFSSCRSAPIVIASFAVVSTFSCSLVLSVDGLGGGSDEDAGHDVATDSSASDTFIAIDSSIDVTADASLDDSRRDDVAMDDGTTVEIGDSAIDAMADTAEAAVADTGTDTPLACATCALSALYRTTTPGSPTPQVLPFLEIANAGPDDQPLSDITIRYWYTINGDRPQIHNCDFSKVGCGNIVFSFVKMAAPKATANYYLELAFLPAAGTVGAGSNSGEIQNRINKDDFSTYLQTDDWSFDGTKTALTAWDHVTIYRKGALVYGVEPP